MSYFRLLRTTGVTLTRTFTVDGEPTDATAGVTVTLYRLDGSVAATGSAGHPGAAGVYTFAVPPTATADVDMMRMDWVGTLAGASVTLSDWVEVVGGFMFDLDEARAVKPELPVTKYPNAYLATKRIVVESAAESITGVTFVPRFKRIALNGNGSGALLVPMADLRTLRAVRVNGTDWSPDQVAAVWMHESGVLELQSGIWPWGARNVIVELEHGLDVPPPYITEAGIEHLRAILSGGTSANGSTPANAISTVTAEGQVFRLSTPSRQRIGVPTVDAAYERAFSDIGGFA